MALWDDDSHETPRKRIDRRPAVVHFSGDAKPWTRTAYHPYAWLYYRSLAKTPYYADQLKRIGVERWRLLKWRLRATWWLMKAKA